jgi:hypothetical protein
MKNFEINEMSDSSILALNDIRDTIQIDPDYQRPGGVWSRKNKQLFIDSLLNGYDIPKLYFHRLSGSYAKPGFDYAIIDGRQRLEAIWGFIDGDFALADDFKFFDNENFDAAGMTFEEIEQEYPRLLIRFHARTLSVMIVVANDLDFIEDMFSRLNEAVPLNAAEKRNALGGPLPAIIKDIAKHPYFANKVKFPGTRYRYFDVAAKILVQQANDDVVDTKKARLDDFVKKNKAKTAKNFANLVKETKANLDILCGVFSDKDDLLKSSGMSVVYYVLAKRGVVKKISRNKLVKFEKARMENRERFAQDEDDVNYLWIEYDELAQSANDAAAIKARVETLEEYLA